MTMDEEGLLRRRSKKLSYTTVWDLLSEDERAHYFDTKKVAEGSALHHAVRGNSRKKKRQVKDELQALAFGRLSYDDKLRYCDRPEQIDGPSPKAWAEINAHLGTSASSLPELVHELGERRFGRAPRVGDAFCGGGSIPFEAARLGFDAYGSDLNPVAALLTWGALNIIGGDEKVADRVREAQKRVYRAVDKQITEWGVELNEHGWRADAYLYCVEARCPETGMMVPLAPSWVIGERTKTIAKLVPNGAGDGFDIRIEQDVSREEVVAAKSAGTIRNNKLFNPVLTESMAARIDTIREGRRGDGRGLRVWENEDLVPREDDVFQERLYCIRWIERLPDGTEVKHYCAPTEADLEREERVLSLLRDRFEEWQAEGYIPSMRIEPGEKTDEPIRTRGWTYWHHLFNPRQLLLHGLSTKALDNETASKEALVGGYLSVGRAINWNSRLTQWMSSAVNEGGSQVFSNQALNTLWSYSARPVSKWAHSWFFTLEAMCRPLGGHVRISDARDLATDCELWVTDPPYADAINYHELGDFFLAWYQRAFARLFPDWTTDGRRALAVVGQDEDFRRSMVDCYRNLTCHMPDDGIQVVMFTHQDAGVWADLALILWAAGLRVTAAWTIATETDSALKTGNHVQGTVLLVLRKRTTRDKAFQDELVFEIEDEVKRQLDSMKALDEDEADPNFGDTDYQLAAYAAALRVLTQYGTIEGLNIERELSRPRTSGEKNPIAALIEQAVKIAADHLIPKGFDSFVWRTLTAEERLYLKGLELEAHGEYRNGAYQELARGFGVREYTHLYASGTANETRFMNATEFGRKELGKSAFGSSLVRNALFAVREARAAEEASIGRNWLRNELPDYWSQRKTLLEVLRYFERMGHSSEAWREDAEAAGLVAGAVANDHA
jgi:putative DNA methylase